MAIGINNNPTKLNAAYTNLIYTVQSTKYAEPQFQYVMDITSGSQILARIRQYPNPSGKAVFDPSDIIQNYLEYQDVDISQFSGLADMTVGNSEASKQLQEFTIKFGEEYGTSISSSVYLYDGRDVYGPPAVSSSVEPLQIFQAQVDYNDYWQATTEVGYNFFTGSRTVDTGEQFTFGYNKFLTYQPEFDSSIRTDDSIGINYQDSGVVQAIVNQSPGDSIRIVTTGFNSSGGSTSGDTKVLSGLTFPTILTVPISPVAQGWTESQFNSLDRFKITLANNATPSSPFATFNIYKDLDACNYKRLSIQFINRLGAWDFYGFSLPSNESVRIERDLYQKPFVDYSTPIGNSNFNTRRRGTTTYNTSRSKSYTFTTPYLSQKQAFHVEQIFDSPEVRILYPGGLNNSRFSAQPMPVVVRDGSYVKNTNSRGQKLFQYTFTFELSNNPQGRQ